MSTWFTSGVKSQYVTYTAPNHMSIATGLFEEEHGIVGNYFFDADTKKALVFFLLENVKRTFFFSDLTISILPEKKVS